MTKKFSRLRSKAMDVNVAALERRLERAAKAAAGRRLERDQTICDLAKLGVTLERIGQLAGGLTKGRVSQIVTKGKLDAASDPDEGEDAQGPNTET